MFIILGIILTLIVATIIVIIVLNKEDKFEDPFEDIDDLVLSDPTNSTREYEDVINVASALEKDYSENKISADEYILQLAYSVYDYSLLDEKYKSYDNKDNYDILEDKVWELAELLSEDTYKYMFEKIMLSDIEIDVDLTEETKNLVNKEFRKANIDYNSNESKFKRIHRRALPFTKILVFESFIFQGLIYIIITAIIWAIYEKLTWNIYQVNKKLQYIL